MKNYVKTTFLLLGLALCASAAFSQNTQMQYDRSKYRNEPVWIAMMNDPQANYYETILAFRTFWKGYALPGEPIELERNDRFEREVGLETETPSKDPNERAREKEREKNKKKRIIDGQNFAFEVKQFKGWMIDAKPWVQPDGHILTIEERQAILDQQQRELKAAENKH